VKYADGDGVRVRGRRRDRGSTRWADEEGDACWETESFAIKVSDADPEALPEDEPLPLADALIVPDAEALALPDKLRERLMVRDGVREEVEVLDSVRDIVLDADPV